MRPRLDVRSGIWQVGPRRQAKRSFAERRADGAPNGYAAAAEKFPGVSLAGRRGRLLMANCKEASCVTEAGSGIARAMPARQGLREQHRKRTVCGLFGLCLVGPDSVFKKRRVCRAR